MDVTKAGSLQIAYPKDVSKTEFFERTSQKPAKCIFTPRQRSLRENPL